MNIFMLDNDLEKCAQMHVDKHVVKQLLEYTQLLCSAYYFTDEAEKSPYKLTHKNHPCSKWVRESLDNWLLLQELVVELYVEYQYRYSNKLHKSGELALTLTPPNLPYSGRTTLPQCMPDKYRHDDVVRAYRAYYNGEKQGLFNWKFRPTPNWVSQERVG